MKTLQEHLNEALNEAYMSWTAAIPGCMVVYIEKRKIAIVPTKGNFPKSFPAEKRENILKNCGFTNIQLTVKLIKGKEYTYFIATIPNRWPDNKEIESIEDKLNR